MRGFLRCTAYVAILAGAAVPAFAQQTIAGGVASGVGAAVKQPFKDLSLIRDKTPEPLSAASKAVYNKGDGDLDCSEITSEIATLDKLLGPDLDAGKAAKQNTALGIATDLMRGASDIPFRGVVRRVSGAYQRDADQNRAVIAGMVRRGYLKGLAENEHCGAGSDAVADNVADNPAISEAKVADLVVAEPKSADAPTAAPTLIDAPARPVLPVIAFEAPHPRTLAVVESD